jgi:hypothetical protein
METPANYQLQDSEMPCAVGLLEEKTSHNFLDLLAANARAMIIAGKLLPGREGQLIDEAIRLRLAYGSPLQIY